MGYISIQMEITKNKKIIISNFIFDIIVYRKHNNLSIWIKSALDVHDQNIYIPRGKRYEQKFTFYNFAGYP